MIPFDRDGYMKYLGEAEDILMEQQEDGEIESFDEEDVYFLAVDLYESAYSAYEDELYDRMIDDMLLGDD